METWPLEQLMPQRGGRPNYRSRNLAGTASLSGFMQVVAVDAGIWETSYEQIPLHGWPMIQTWDTLALRLEGRLNPILVPLCEGKRQPLTPVVIDGEAGVELPGLPHSDDTYFSDDVGYRQSAGGGGAKTLGNAERRATSIRINKPGAPIEPAHFFSIGVRLYQVRAVVSAANNVYTLDIRPPLREAVGPNTTVEFDRPVCKMRLASDDEMIRNLDGNRYGLVNVRFLEDMF